MTVPVLSIDEFIEYMKSSGWTVKSSIFWDEYNRLIVEKDGVLVTLQCRTKLFFFEVVNNCNLLQIKPPPEHIHAYYRHHKMDNEPCYCNGKKPFKDCHGKI